MRFSLFRPLGRSHGLRGHQYVPDRRPAPAHLQDARWRQDLDAHHHGIPDGGIINVVREDPKRKGLLFAGSEQAVYVSFDDGDHWQSLRMNMPATSIRDLIIKDDDVMVGTHGRSFWILDDITPLRQLTPQVAMADVFLFKPQEAWRVKWNRNTDTPLPPDEPAGQNPPDGAIINYTLKSAATGPVSLEILDASGTLVRKYSSDDKPDPIDDIGNAPRYWLRPTQILSGAAGFHRFVWDLHYAPPAVQNFSYPISAKTPFLGNGNEHFQLAQVHVHLHRFYQYVLSYKSKLSI